MTFVLAGPAGVAVPRVVERNVAASQAWSLGALLLIDGAGAFAECGADPALLFGVAESDYGPDTTGFNLYGREGFPPGKMQVTKALDNTFHAEYEGSLPASDGGSYGVVRSTDGKWRVDFTETVNTRLKLVGRLDAVGAPVNGIPVGLSSGSKRVLVKFIAANCQDY